jgi:oxygen-dependent protoporphyrinogen oxidase
MPSRPRAGSALVIGGGIAGAVGARRLAQHGYDVTLCERSSELGGRIRSGSIGGTTIELGAQFITSFYRGTLALLSELSMLDELVEIRRDLGIVQDGQPQLLTAGSPVFGGRYLSATARLHLARALLDVARYWRRLDINAIGKAAAIPDVSVASRWRHADLRGNLLDPVLDGFFYWDPERTSNAVLLILLKAGLRLRHMYAFRPGMSDMVAHLVDLPNIEVVRACAVTSVAPIRNGYRATLETRSSSSTMVADVVLCATPATEVAHIVRGLAADQREFFERVSYSSTAVTVYDVPHAVSSPAFPVMVRSDDRSILSMIGVLSRRTTSEPLGDRDVISLYTSGAASERLLELSDQDIVRHMTEAAKLASTTFDCERRTDELVQRWPQALPRFPPGYLARLRDVGALGERRLAFAGDYLGGPLIEGAVTSAESAARKLLAQAID